MMKNIYSVWKMSKKELIVMLLTLIVCGIIGMGMMLLLYLADGEIPFFALGAMFMVELWLLINLCLSLFSYQNIFDLIVSMGCRRKDFIISQIITVYMLIIKEPVVYTVLCSFDRIWKEIMKQLFLFSDWAKRQEALYTTEMVNWFSHPTMKV